jgi:hypothetical protein
MVALSSSCFEMFKLVGFQTVAFKQFNLNSQMKQATLGRSPTVALFHSCKGGVEFTLQC